VCHRKKRYPVHLWAEVTSSGRSFHVRGSTTGKARLVGDGCQLDRRHWQTVGASRTERSTARQGGDVVKWTEVLSYVVLNSLLTTAMIFPIRTAGTSYYSRGIFVVNFLRFRFSFR